MARSPASAPASPTGSASAWASSPVSFSAAAFSPPQWLSTNTRRERHEHEHRRPEPPTTNVPSQFATIPLSGSLGAVVDTGGTQGSTQRQFSLVGLKTDCADVLDSQDGTNFAFVERLFGGDREVVLEVARYVRTERQQGTTAVTCGMGDLVLPGTVAPGLYWQNGANPGALTATTPAGDSVTIGSGGAAIPTVTAGGFAVGSEEEIAFTAGTTWSATAGAGNASLDASATVALGAVTATHCRDRQHHRSLRLDRHPARRGGHGDDRRGRRLHL